MCQQTGCPTSQTYRRNCPVSILHGTKDNLVPYGNVAFMKRYIPIDCLFEVITLTGRNHFIPWNSKPFLDLAVAKTAHQVRCVNIAK